MLGLAREVKHVRRASSIDAGLDALQADRVRNGPVVRKRATPQLAPELGLDVRVNG